MFQIAKITIIETPIPDMLGFFTRCRRYLNCYDQIAISVKYFLTTGGDLVHKVFNSSTNGGRRGSGTASTGGRCSLEPFYVTPVVRSKNLDFRTTMCKLIVKP